MLPTADRLPKHILHRLPGMGVCVALRRLKRCLPQREHVAGLENRPQGFHPASTDVAEPADLDRKLHAGKTGTRINDSADDMSRDCQNAPQDARLIPSSTAGRETGGTLLKAVACFSACECC